MNKEYLQSELIRESGVNPKKCMRCGKCSATCPAYDAMEYHPHQFVYMVESGDIEPLLKSESLYVEPAKLVEAVRLAVVREQGKNRLKADDVPALADDETPQQLLVSAFRKYSK